MQVLKEMPHSGEDLALYIAAINPDDAAQMLTSARNADRIDQRAIRVYAEDMKRGLWKLNGEPIVIGRDGDLLSGRLRLHACITAGTSFTTLLVKGVSSSTFDTIDAIRRRTHADILTIRKEKNGRAIAAAINILWRIKDGSIVGKQKQISSQTLLHILDKNPDIRVSAVLTRDVHPILPHGVAIALHYLFSTINIDLSNQFFQRLVDPEIDHPEASPKTLSNAPSLLRQQMVAAIDKGGARNQSQLIGLTIKAWEAFRQDRNIGTLKLHPEEKFPEISDLKADLVNSLDQEEDISSYPPEDLHNAFESRASDIVASVQIVSPEQAEIWLSNNDGNRKIVSSVVEKYARDMRDGKWKLNGQTIKIASSGRLLDGQHRCAAAVSAKRSFEAFVVNGLDESVFDTFDLGARRSIGDILKDMGEENYSTLAASLRQAWLLYHDYFQMRAISPTVSELLYFLQQHSAIRESARQGHKIRDILAPGLGCALHFLFSVRNATKADEFMDRLGDGNYLYPKHPIALLRDKLLKDRISRKRNMADAEKAALIIKAWHAFVDGREIAQLKWQNAGPNKEPFPNVFLTSPKQG